MVKKKAAKRPAVRKPTTDFDDSDVVAESENPDYQQEQAKESESFDAAQFLSDARERMESAEAKERDNWVRAEKDLDMLAGDGQWPESIKKEREADGRPCLTFNRFPQFTDQVIGEYRKNPPGIRIRSHAGSFIGADEIPSAQKPPAMMPPGPDPGGAPMQQPPMAPPPEPKKYRFSDVMAGIIRNIEAASSADIAYENALESVVSCGMGHYRILTKYVEDGFDQDVFIEPILDPFSVKWDPSAVDWHRSDARYAFIDTKMARSEFEAMYPSAVVDTSGMSSGNAIINMADWITDSEVRVCEYFVVTEKQKTLRLLSDGRTVSHYEGEFEAIADELSEQGVTVIKERPVMARCIEWYLITAYDVLEGPIKLPGKYIPIISVWGKEQWHQGSIRRRSLISNSHDSQRMYNFMRSAAAEYIALAPKSPFVVAAGQLEGYRNVWQQANKKNLAYLPYKHVDGVSAPQRMNPPMISSGISNEVVTANEDIKATMGMYDASLGRQSNEVSGKAILARAQEGDTMAYAFIDNAGRALQHCGRVLIDYIVNVYDTERVLRIMNEDGTDDIVVINQSVVDRQTAKEVKMHDLSAVKYEVTVDIGPSYLTKKLEASSSMMEFVQAFPAAAPAIGDLIALNMDWPGARELAKRLRRMIPPQISGETPPPDPNLEMQMQIENTKKETAMLLAEAARLTAQVKVKEAEAAIATSKDAIQSTIASEVAAFIQAAEGNAPVPPMPPEAQPVV